MGVVEFLQRVPLLLITAALLIGGVFENEIGSGSQAMLAVGFVSFGSWLTIEIQTWHQRLRLTWEAKSAAQVNTAIVPLDQFFDPKDGDGESTLAPYQQRKKEAP